MLIVVTGARVLSPLSTILGLTDLRIQGVNHGYWSKGLKPLVCAFEIHWSWYLFTSD